MKINVTKDWIVIQPYFLISNLQDKIIFHMASKNDSITMNNIFCNDN